ncbi:MAG: cytochrome P450 [Myxococcota bacterium]|nr:cytochrome P450 [Myxococcota bacterium]
MSSGAPAYEDFNLVHPEHYAQYGYPHEIWTRLRREAPVYRWEQDEGPPFWAITKHSDITAISKQPELFVSNPRTVVSHLPEQNSEALGFPPTLIQLDPPKHGIYRQLVSKRFTPRALKRIHDPIEQIGKEIVDALVKDKDHGECDFVAEVSAPLPIAVIAWLLGVPKSDWNLLFDWTNRIIGAGDPDFQVEGQTSTETATGAMTELFTYFSQMVEEKKKKPEDDLVTLFTEVEVDGKKLEMMDVLAWCMIIVIAGNETTRNGTSGGMLAFIEHQDQLRKLQGEPELLPAAVEEVVRWTSPIIHFARTATADTEIRGHAIREGDILGLFYASANRDEEVFDDPFSFQIDRIPNRHLGFGVGEHFCLGAHLARLEMCVAYKYLLPRIEEIELTGPVERLHSALVGGVKKLPIRYKLRPE